VAEVKTAEVDAANKYIADNKLVVKTTPSGLKYVITQPTLKRKPLTGDTLLVNYTGHTLDGKVFDSSIKAVADKAGLQEPGRVFEPYQVIAGIGQVIQGWNEGLLLLNEGSKAQFIIPSSLAYGAEGSGADIPPYSTLVFDLELVKIKPIKHAAPVAKKVPVKHTAAKKKS
jgi:FKBP-type peptidyl-prolyl cis-trans isomerase